VAIYLGIVGACIWGVWYFVAFVVPLANEYHGRAAALLLFLDIFVVVLLILASLVGAAYMLLFVDIGRKLRSIDKTLREK
jgi:hypothetical protein